MLRYRSNDFLFICCRVHEDASMQIFVFELFVDEIFGVMSILNVIRTFLFGFNVVKLIIQRVNEQTGHFVRYYCDSPNELAWPFVISQLLGSSWNPFSGIVNGNVIDFNYFFN